MFVWKHMLCTTLTISFHTLHTQTHVCVWKDMLCTIAATHGAGRNRIYSGIYIVNSWYGGSWATINISKHIITGRIVAVELTPFSAACGFQEDSLASPSSSLTDLCILSPTLVMHNYKRCMQAICHN